MKKQSFILFCLLLFTPVFASGAKEIPNWATPEKMYKKVEKQLKHDLRKYEQTITDTTYLYYYGQCNGNWTREIWDVAVAKSVEMCRNSVAIAAAKTGLFGEKLLKALAATTENAVSGINNWIESGSQEFDEKHNR